MARNRTIRRYNCGDVLLRHIQQKLLSVIAQKLKLAVVAITKWRIMLKFGTMGVFRSKNTKIARFANAVTQQRRVLAR